MATLVAITTEFLHGELDAFTFTRTYVAVFWPASPDIDEERYRWLEKINDACEHYMSPEELVELSDPDDPMWIDEGQLRARTAEAVSEIAEVDARRAAASSGRRWWQLG